MAIWNTIQFLWSCFLWESTVKSLIAFVVSGFLLLLHEAEWSEILECSRAFLPGSAQPFLVCWWCFVAVWLQGSLGHAGPGGDGDWTFRSSLSSLGAEVFTTCTEHWGCPCPWWVMSLCGAFGIFDYFWFETWQLGGRKGRRWWPRGWCRKMLLFWMMQWVDGSCPFHLPLHWGITSLQVISSCSACVGLACCKFILLTVIIYCLKEEKKNKAGQWVLLHSANKKPSSPPAHPAFHLSPFSSWW